MGKPEVIYLFPDGGNGEQNVGDGAEWGASLYPRSGGEPHVPLSLTEAEAIAAERARWRGALVTVREGLLHCCGTLCDRRALIELINTCLGDEAVNADRRQGREQG